MKTLHKIMEILTSLMVLVTVVAIAAGVFYRYVLKDSLTYTSELSALMYAHIIFWGISLTLKDNGLIGVDILTNQMNDIGKTICRYVSLVIMLLISVFMAYQGGILMMKTNTNLATLGISMKYLYASMPIGFGIFALNLLIELIADIRSRGKGGEA